MAVTGYHRKYAIQVLNHPPKRRKRKKRTSQTKYQGEVDLVAHCGETTRGEYLNSLDMVDVCTRWVELAALVNRSQATVTAAIAAAQARLPYPLLGIEARPEAL